MRILHQTPGLWQVSGFPGSFPPNYSQVFRFLDDIGPRHAGLIAQHCGGDPSRLLEVGYGLVSPAFLRVFGAAPRFIKIGAIVLPCRNAQGQIVALHDHRLEWLTPPEVHVSNPLRGPWAEIEVCETTSQADSRALTANICAIGRNGCDRRAVAAAVLSARRLYSADTIKRGENWRESEAAA